MQAINPGTRSVEQVATSRFAHTSDQEAKTTARTLAAAAREPREEKSGSPPRAEGAQDHAIVTNAYLDYTQDPETGRVMARVIDAESGDVLREVPIPQLHDGAVAALEALRGILIDRPV